MEFTAFCSAHVSCRTVQNLAHGSPGDEARYNYQAGYLQKRLPVLSGGDIIRFKLLETMQAPLLDPKTQSAAPTAAAAQSVRDESWRLGPWFLSGRMGEIDTTSAKETAAVETARASRDIIDPRGWQCSGRDAA